MIMFIILQTIKLLNQSVNWEHRTLNWYQVQCGIMNSWTIWLKLDSFTWSTQADKIRDLQQSSPPPPPTFFTYFQYFREMSKKSLTGKQTGNNVKSPSRNNYSGVYMLKNLNNRLEKSLFQDELDDKSWENVANKSSSFEAKFLPSNFERSTCW